MAKSVFKYPIDIVNVQTIPVKAGAIPLHVGLDPNGKPCIWMKVDPEVSETMPFLVYVVGTGHRLVPSAQIHLGTFVSEWFVWHVFTTDDEFPI